MSAMSVLTLMTLYKKNLVDSVTDMLKTIPVEDLQCCYQKEITLNSEGGCDSTWVVVPDMMMMMMMMIYA